ncbi:MAG: transcriptional regulator [Comamonadaceae bacterium]|nr:transcriptional regulator [Burkholderiales bacterium]MEB2347872.1 transcriptional regulator [Comamonadaceae bacterium]
MGPTDQEGTEDDLVALYAGHQVDTFDAAVLPDADMGDIDPAAVTDYRQQRRAINPDAEELGWSDDDLLRSLGCARRDNGQLKPTVAGITLFGTSQALRRCFPMMRIDYIRVPGRQWVENPDHRFDTLEIRAPLFTAIRRATNAVRDELLQSFSLPEGALAREDEPALPLRVIREAIVNAVMYRSYRIHGAVQIIRYANRLEIRNPGHSIKAEEQLGEPGSETRNPRIAAVLHEVNIAETKGSGIRAMRELMLAHGLLPPTFESSRRPDQFVATFLFHHFLGASDLAWLRQLTSEPISDEESRALVFVRELGAIDNAAYRAINRTDTLSASAHLRRLRDLELLEMKGSGSRTYYVPGVQFQARTEAGASAKPTANTRPPNPDSHQPNQNSHQPNQDSHHLLATIPPQLAERIPSAGSKPRRDILRALIIDLCRWHALSARELAGILHRRDHKPLVRDYLTPMVSEGLLAYTIPKMENHPDQRYTVSAEILKSD